MFRILGIPGWQSICVWPGVGLFARPTGSDKIAPITPPTPSSSLHENKPELSARFRNPTTFKAVGNRNGPNSEPDWLAPECRTSAPYLETSTSDVAGWCLD